MRKAKIKSTVLCPLIATLLCSSTNALAQGVAPVPSAYAKTYAAINTTVDTFITGLDKRQLNPSSTRFASGLDTARGSNGLQLLKSDAISKVETELNRFNQLGISAVTIAIGFPIACPQFWGSDTKDFKAILAFYQQVGQLCRARGMKVLVEAHPQSPGRGGSFGQQAKKFSSSLSGAIYQHYMAEHIANIAASTKPDVISIVDEPNTDFAWTGQSVYRKPETMAAFVQAMTNQIAVSNSVNHTKIVAAAGADSWMVKALDFNGLLCKITGLGAIDIHTYFSGGNDLERAIALADQAHAAGKTVVVSECWLTKVGTGIPPVRPKKGQAIAARSVNSFSFWQPLDKKYMSAFTEWCKVENPNIFCFYYPQLLFAYLDYNKVQSLSEDAIITAEMQAELQAMKADQFSPTGVYYSQLLGQQK